MRDFLLYNTLQTIIQASIQAIMADYGEENCRTNRFCRKNLIFFQAIPIPPSFNVINSECLLF